MTSGGSHEIDALVATARELGAAGLAVAGAGNISVRVADGILVTAAGTRLSRVTTSDICHVDLDGQTTGGQRPSSELELHRRAYRHEHVGAVVHLHGAHSTAVGLNVDVLPAIHYSIHRLGGRVPVVPYSVFGGSRLAGAVESAIDAGHLAVLLRNHGSVAVGRNLADAAEKAELLEWLCQAYLLASGQPMSLLDDSDLDEVRTMSAQVSYGSVQS